MPRTVIAFRIAALSVSACLLPQLLACLDHPIKPVDLETAANKILTVDVNPIKNVDVLFVIDNSGSMGEEQGTLAANFAAFIDVLEEPDVDANYRIAVTTTDNGNPRCDGTGPEGGAFVLKSCLDRLEDFVFAANTAEELDKKLVACEANCAFAGIEVSPTPLHAGGTSAPRPWLERIEGGTNLPGGLTSVEAFQCLGPQGINGCGFESPLESMYRALKRAVSDDQTESGFLRDDALLAIVFVTDEEDCSFRENHRGIFLDDGGKAFWSDPTRPFPTSAVCWNAGVECSGGPGTYDECHAQHHAEDGSVTDEAGAVLHPVSRYVDLLRGFEKAKADLPVDQSVFVSVIAGVPGGYPGSPLVYQDASNPTFQDDFGIGPGCVSENGTAVPPVRIREFAESFPSEEGGPNMFSICSADYRPALQAIADQLRDNLVPACMPSCALDLDPGTAGLQPSCNLQEFYGGVDHEVPTCEKGPEGFSLPANADVCWYAQTGSDMHDDCVKMGTNMEFKLVRREGVPAPSGSRVSATCEISQTPKIDCPLLQ